MMDLQVQTGSTSISDSQQQVVASIYPSLQHLSSTSLQSPTSQEVLSVSSLVPSTVLTLMPHYKHATSEKLQQQPPSFSESELQLPGTLSFTSGSSEAQDQKTLTSAFPCSDNLEKVQQRKPSDFGPLEEGSVSLMIPKDLPAQESGKEII